MANDDRFRSNRKQSRKEKKEKMQKAAAATAQKLHLVLDSSSSKSGNFVCVVEDFYNLWPHLLREIITDVNISSAKSITSINVREPKNAVVVKASHNDKKEPQYRDLWGKKYVGEILQQWGRSCGQINFASGESSFQCKIKGQNLTIDYSNRVFGIVDLDHHRIGSEGRISKNSPRKIRTDPWDTESMLFRLNPSKLLFKLGIQESALPAIVICAKRLAGVLRLLKNQNIAANFLNPRGIDDCKTLFSFLNWNPISNEIEIDSDGLFEYFLKNSTKPKEIRCINDDFVKRLKSTNMPDVFQGHVISAMLLYAREKHVNANFDFSHYRDNDFYKFQKLFEKALRLVSKEFADSEMGTDIVKWFIDRDISSE